MAPGGQNTPDVLDGQQRRPRRLGPGGLQQGTVRPFPRDPFGFAPTGGDPNQMTPDIPEGKFPDDPTVDETIIIDDPMAPDPLANQGGGSY